MLLNALKREAKPPTVCVVYIVRMTWDERELSTWTLCVARLFPNAASRSFVGAPLHHPAFEHLLTPQLMPRNALAEANEED
jgi:hypothetical protein